MLLRGGGGWEERYGSCSQHWCSRRRLWQEWVRLDACRLQHAFVCQTVPCTGTLWACAQEPHTAHLSLSTFHRWSPAHSHPSVLLASLPTVPLFPPPAPCIFCAVYEPSLLSAASPVLCQSISNLQLLRLFSSLLPLGSVSGTVSFFIPLYSPVSLPFSALSPSLLHPLLSGPPSLSFCLSVLLAHTFLPPSEVWGSDHLALTQIKFPLTYSLDLGPRHLCKAPRHFPRCDWQAMGYEVLLVNWWFSLFPAWCCWSFSTWCCSTNSGCWNILHRRSRCGRACGYRKGTVIPALSLRLLACYLWVLQAFPEQGQSLGLSCRSLPFCAKQMKQVVSWSCGAISISRSESAEQLHQKTAS